MPAPTPVSSTTPVTVHNLHHPGLPVFVTAGTTPRRNLFAAAGDDQLDQLLELAAFGRRFLDALLGAGADLLARARDIDAPTSTDLVARYDQLGAIVR